jgi:hypothetical protein
MTQSLVDRHVPRLVKSHRFQCYWNLSYFQCSKWDYLFQSVFEMSIREKAKVSSKFRKEEKLRLKEERQASNANKEFPP